jgi:hypothetical protein
MTSRLAMRCALLGAVVIAPCLASAQLPKKPNEVVEAAPIHGFSVALVLGDLQGASTADNLPLGAKKALADLRDFVPYKSYRLLDVQFIRCCASKGAGLLSGRLRGLDEQQYSFVVDYGVVMPKLAIRFSLREESSSKKLAAANSDVSTLMAQLEELKRKGYNANHPAMKELMQKMNRQMQEIEEQRGLSQSPKSSVIDSTFSMDVGETVVIGTSSLKGDKALIALLTAVRRPDSPSGTQGEKK